MATGGSGQVDAANLAKVGHVVVVMLENRSFDHMLGYLSLTGARPEIDGLRPGLANEYQGRPYPVHHLTATALGIDPDHSASAIDRQVAGGEMSGFVASAAAALAERGIDHTSIIKTILLRFCPQALHEPEPAKPRRRSRARLGPQYPGMRVAQASHLGGLLTRATPRPAPPRDALVQHAAARAAQAGPGDPGTGQRPPADRPLNDLQQRILAATRELRRRGHPPDTP